MLYSFYCNDDLTESLFGGNNDTESVDLKKEEKELLVKKEQKKVLVEVCEASDLQLRNSILRPNPYVKFYVNQKAVFKTKVKSSTLYPQWFEREQIWFSEHDTLYVEVWATRSLKGDVNFGNLRIPLNSLALTQDEPREIWFYLLNGHPEEKIKLNFTALNYSSLDSETVRREKNFLAAQEKQKTKFQKSQEVGLKDNEKVKVYFMILSSFDDVKYSISKEIYDVEKERLTSYEKTISSMFSSLYDRLSKERTYQVNIFNDAQNMDYKMKYGVDKVLLQTIDEIAVELAKLKIFQHQSVDALEILAGVENRWHVPKVSDFLNSLSTQNSIFSYFKFKSVQIHQPRKQYNSNKYLPNDLYEEVVAIWICYEHRPRWMWNRVFNSDYDKRLLGYGDWVIANEIHLEKYQVNFHCTFALSEEYGTVVCAVRGTEFNKTDRKLETLKGWIANLYASLVDFPFPRNSKTKVHKGFYDQYINCSEEVEKQMEQYLKMGFRVVMTGHSQGASVATIMAAHIGFKFPEYKKQMQLITFGSPKVGNYDFADFVDTTYPEAKRFVTKLNIEDYITTTPPSFLGFVHLGKPHYVNANKKWMGNPNPIPGISYQSDVEYRSTLEGFLIHFQQVYMDGILESKNYVE
eukprot:gene12217-5803_t